jgi:hypothetical protein
MRVAVTAEVVMANRTRGSSCHSVCSCAASRHCTRSEPIETARERTHILLHEVAREGVEGVGALKERDGDAEDAKGAGDAVKDEAGELLGRGRVAFGGFVGRLEGLAVPGGYGDERAGDDAARAC